MAWFLVVGGGGAWGTEVASFTKNSSLAPLEEV